MIPLPFWVDKLRKALALTMGAASLASAGQLSVHLPDPPLSLGASPLRLGGDDRNGFFDRGQPGEPQLPERVFSILLPPQTDPSTVTVSVAGGRESEETGVQDIPPGFPVAVNADPVWPAGKRILEGRDLDVYGSDAFHPAQRLGQIKIHRWGAYQILEVPYRPWRWNPRRGLLRKTRGASLEVHYGERKASTSLSGVGQVNGPQVASLVSNPEMVAAYTGGVSTSAAADTGTFLIVASNAVRSGSTKLLEFARSKAERGFRVRMVSQTGEWELGSDGNWACGLSDCSGGWGGGTGNTGAENIRTWIKAKYVAWGVKYVLLMGNPHPTTGDVPMKMTWPRRAEGDYPDCPTDYFFAELSGNWDLDANGFAGEYPADYASGGIDKFPEVSVGRIPYYGVVADFDKILAKSIAFEKSTDIAWRRNALLPMEPSDASTPGYHLGEQIRTNFLLPRDIASTRIYDEDYGVGPEITPCNVTNVRSAWSSGKFGVTTWWTHGSATSASDIFSSYDAIYLDDNHPSFTFQNSCTNGSPENSNNLGYALLRNGAIGTVSASRVSWYWRGQTDFTGAPCTNSMMAYAYTGALGSDSLRAGDALNKVRRSMIVNGSWWAMNLADFNLYGDPSLGLYTAGAEVPAPTGLSAAAGIRRIRLSWNVFPATSRYYVKKRGADGLFHVVDSVVGVSWSDTGLADNTSHTYTVSARLVAGTVSGDSRSATGLTAPAAVRVLGVTPSNHKLRITWSATAGASAYQVSVSILGTDSLRLAGGTSDTAFEVTGLVNDSTYRLVVAAVNAQGTRGANSEAATGKPVFSLEKVVGLVATSGDQRVDLTWKKVEGADFYVVHRWSQADGILELDSTIANAYTDRTVVNGQLYVYQVQAAKNGMRGPLSDTVSVVPKIPAPVSPTGLVAKAQIRSVALSWDTVATATSYVVYRKTDSVAAYESIAQTSRNTFVDTTAVPGVPSFYAVAAVNAGGSSPRSARVVATALPPVPVAPTGLVAVPGDRALTVSWAPSTWAKSYSVKIATVAGGPYTEAAKVVSGTSTVLTGLTNGTTYYLVVAALNASGESPNSQEASAIPVPPPSGIKVLYKVGDNSATDNTIRPLLQIVNAGTTAVSLSDVTIRYWYVNVPSRGQNYWCDWAQMGCSNISGSYTSLAVPVPGADGYMEISFREAAGSLAAGASTGEIQSRFTRVDWSNHDETTDWSYDATKIAYADAVNVTVYKAGTLVWGKEPGVRQVPGVPTEVKGFVGVRRDTVSWKAALNDVSFNVYRSVAGGAKSKVYAGAVTSFVDTGLVGGTAYTYWVSGVNGSLESALSDSVVLLPNGEAPAKVTGLSAKPGDHVVNLAWTASPTATVYKVLRSTNASTYQQVGTSVVASYADATASNDTAWIYKVVASNVWGDAAASDTVSAMPKVPRIPGVPTDVTGFAGVRRDTVAWKAAVNDLSFNVYRSVAGGVKSKVYAGTMTSFVDTGLVGGTAYTYWVSGVNGSLESALSDSVVLLPNGEAPAKVTGLSAKAGDHVVNLAWAASPRATVYKVLRSTNASTYQQVGTSVVASYADATASNDTAWIYKVVASNVWGDAAASDTVSAMPKAPPAASLKIQYRTGNAQVSTNAIQPMLQLVNTGKSPVDLSEVAIRYWFTNDGTAAVNYWCDWAQIGVANLAGAVKTVSPVRVGADRYLEITFKPSAGALAAGASTGEIQNRFSKADWSNFAQTGDASFDASKTAFADWNKVTVYRNGVLVWGVEP